MHTLAFRLVGCESVRVHRGPRVTPLFGTRDPPPAERGR